LIVAKYIGGDEFPALDQGAEYDVLAVDIPARGVAYLRVIDASEEDYLYPADRFEIVSGEEQLRDILRNNVRCEIEV
jgi:hypothetical protein